MLYTTVSVSAVQQSESAICVHASLLFGIPSRLGHHRAQVVPCAVLQALVMFSSLSIVYIAVYIAVYNLPIHLTPPSPLAIHRFVFHICFSISALQIRPPLPFF